MDEQGPVAKPPQWRGDLSMREQAQIAHARAYTRSWQEAGVPGHGQFVLIAKLAKKLDDLEYQMANPPDVEPPRV
jgi:hypothetical protein